MAAPKRPRAKQAPAVAKPAPAPAPEALVEAAVPEVVSAAPAASRKVAPPKPDAKAPAPKAAVAPRISEAPPVIDTAAVTEPLKAEPVSQPVVAEVLAAKVDPVVVPDPVVAVETVETIVEAVPEAVETTQKGIIEMATFQTTGVEKIQSMFGDINTRAKTAMEKGTKAVEEMTELTKGNVEAIVQSGRVAAKGAESFGQEAAEYGRKSFEQASGAFKSFASVKSPTELFQLQSEFARNSFDSAIAEASKLSESYVKLMSEVFEPITGRFQVAAEKIKAAAL